MVIEVYKVVQCPSCGKVQSTTADKTFKCFGCGKSRTINPKSKLGFGLKIIKTFNSGEDAAKFIIEYTKQKHNL